MNKQPDNRHFLGIDVGTGSARAGLFDRSGRLLASDSAPVALWREAGDVVEQSSEDIWRAVCRSVRSAVVQAGIAADSIAGIGFDATCSLVVLGEAGVPLPVGPSGDPARNVVVWMDHRAADQARRINQTGEKVLDYVGGTISPEMETPKLLWLAENMPETFSHAWQFMDLTDFLTWRATGSLSRSICTVTCKWTYLGHEDRWDDQFFRRIGLGVLPDEQFRRIGTEIVPGGTRLAAGLTAKAAADLGLAMGTPVAAGLIDAHAGGVGTVGARGAAGTVLTRMAYVFGTSACTMSTTPDPSFVPGVWDPISPPWCLGFGSMKADSRPPALRSSICCRCIRIPRKRHRLRARSSRRLPIGLPRKSNHAAVPKCSRIWSASFMSSPNSSAIERRSPIPARAH
jgi:D-ribulokinase